MKPFLKKVAEFLHSTYGSQIADVQVILPNKRAGLYLGKYLGELYGKPIWAPEFLSIEEFVNKYSGLDPITFTELLFEFYKVHVEIEKSGAQDFDQFLGWAQLVLKDFNDIDAYLVDAVTTFRYLSDAKRLAKWELDAEKKSELEIQYLRFYANLEKYYIQLTQNLKSKSISYSGLASRVLAENCVSKFPSNSIFVFVGFNALTPSEKMIIDFCVEKLNSKVLWDIDRYYFDDQNQEAGMFLRQLLHDVKVEEISYLDSNLLNGKKKIHIHSVGGNILQTKVVYTILDELKENITSEPNNCAVVLADEALMFPILSSLPHDLPEINLTMSFPLVNSQAFQLLNLLIDSVLYAKNGESVDSELLYYHVFAEKIIQHPLLSNAINSDETKNLSDLFVKHIRNNNRVNIQFSSFIEFLDQKANSSCIQLFDSISKLSAKPKIFLEQVQTIFQFLLQEIQPNSEIQNGFLVDILEVIQHLGNLIHKHQLIYTLRSLKKLLKVSAQNHGIPFSGEPLSGIQIMGMLETRLLDFKNLIIVSANAGILPKSQAYQSFIFYDIKRELKLPLPFENDAIFAYHFYRLIQGAENIHILYSNVPGPMGGGEPSQFIRQIELELQNKNSEIVISNEVVTLPLTSLNSDSNKEENEVFVKDEFVWIKLKELAAKGISPSTINNFVSCSMKFYYLKILKLSEQDSVEENIEMKTFGNVIHNTFENLYKPLINKKLHKSDFEQMQSIFVEVLKSEFNKELKGGEIDSGKNHLMFAICNRFVERFLENEIKRIEESNSFIQVTELEKEFERHINIELNDEKLDVKFYGKVDRIDKQNDDFIVWDYKTGNFDTRVNRPSKSIKKELDWKEVLAVNLENQKFSKSFQLMMYVWLIQPSFPQTTSFSSGIIALKTNEPYNLLEIEESTILNGEAMSVFESTLMNIVQRMFDPNEVFSKCTDINTCSTCNFKSLCNR